MTGDYEGKCAVCGLRIVRGWIDDQPDEWVHAPLVPWRCHGCNHRWQGRGQPRPYMTPAYDRCPKCGAMAFVEHKAELALPGQLTGQQRLFD